MLEEIQGIALFGLIVCQYYLIRGCFQIKEEIPIASVSITEKIQATTEILDEVAQLIADFSDGVAGASPPVPHTNGGIGDLLSMFLNNRMGMGQNDSHGSQKQEWEIHPPNDNPPTTETEV